jgi:hypothetical protein
MHVAEPIVLVLHVDRPARKKGDERKSCASEYSSSHVPARWGGMTTSAKERGSVEMDGGAVGAAVVDSGGGSWGEGLLLQYG